MLERVILTNLINTFIDFFNPSFYFIDMMCDLHNIAYNLFQHL